MNRQTETDKWIDPWFRKLSPRLKCLWLWLCDNCDPAGVISLDWELATFQIGEPITDKDLEHFKKQLQQLEGEKFYIRPFIKFQYGTLSHACRPHDKVFRALERHGLPVPETVVLVVPAPTGGNGVIEEFQKFWNAYPKKHAITMAQQVFVEVRAADHLAEILTALERQKKSEDWTKENGKYIPLPANYLRDGRWHDQPSTTPEVKPCRDVYNPDDPRFRPQAYWDERDRQFEEAKRKEHEWLLANTLARDESKRQAALKAQAETKPKFTVTKTPAQ